MKIKTTQKHLKTVLNTYQPMRLCDFLLQRAQLAIGTLWFLLSSIRK